VMLVSRRWFRQFFSRRTETAPPGLLDAPVERAPAHLMGAGAVTHGIHVLTPEADDAPPRTPEPPDRVG